MTYIIPPQSTKQHLQDNKSETSGTIYQTKNINLSKEGLIELGDRTFASFTTDDDADFVSADAMNVGDELFINSTEVFSTNRVELEASLQNREGDTTPPTPGAEDDVIFFNGSMVISDGATIKYESADGEWTTISGTSLNVNAPTCLAVFDAENTLVIARGNKAHFVNTSWAVSGTTLTIPSEYNIHTMCSVGNFLLLGTRNDYGGEAKVFVVSSISATADTVYGIGTNEMFSIIPFKSSGVGMDSLGRLLRYNGGGFDVLATLPIYYENEIWNDSSNEYGGVGVRSVRADGDLVYVNVYANVISGKTSIIPNFPSGVWIYDDTTGSFYHGFSPSYSRVFYAGLSGVSISDNALTSVSTLTGVITGMPIIQEADIIGLENNKQYYVIKTGDTSLKFAETREDALAGTAISISGTVGLGDELWILRDNDYGWSFYDTNRSSLAILSSEYLDLNRVGQIVMTADLFSKTATGTPKTVFNGITPVFENRGHIITPRLESPNLQDIYHFLFLKFKKLKPEDKIVVKYKTEERLNIPKAYVPLANFYLNVSTWTDTDTFTTTADLSDLEVGDEIEIVGGVGAGCTAHITSLTNNSGTWTVELDESLYFVAANDVMIFKADNFKKLKEITPTTETAPLGYMQLAIPMDENKSTFLQLKIELRGRRTTLRELQVSHKPFKMV